MQNKPLHKSYEKQIFFIRHGHAHQGHNGDPDLRALSEKGKLQALESAEFLARAIDPDRLQTIDLYSSPKLRCLETMAPISDKLGVKLLQTPLLTETHYDESTSAFIGRIQEFIARWLRSSASTAIACTHSDVIPEAVRLMTRIDIHGVKNAGIYEIGTTSGKSELVSQWVGKLA